MSHLCQCMCVLEILAAICWLAKAGFSCPCVEYVDFHFKGYHEE